MNIVVINGLKITTSMRYVKFIKSNRNVVSESRISDCCSVEFTEGALASDMRYQNVQIITPNAILRETDFIKITNALADINGLVIKNLTSQEYQWNQFIVADIADFVMNYSEESCTMLIPKLKETDLTTYEAVLMTNPYIELVDDTNLKSLTNIYGFQFYRNNVSIESKNHFVFNQKAFYTQYLLSDIDIVSSFIRQFRSYLAEYGLTLHRYPIDEETLTANRIIYRVSEYGKQVSRRTNHPELRDAIQHTTKIDFEVTVIDNTVLDDFVTRYQNLDLISEFTQFYTKDKTHREWLSNIWWEPINADRQAEYATDSQGNSAVTAQFSCQLNYYVVYDQVYREIAKVILEMTGSDLNGEEEITEENEVVIDNEGTDGIEADLDLEEWELLRR